MTITSRGPRRRLRAAAILGLGLGLAATGAAHGASPPARFGRLSVEDGLSQSSVTQILQDRLGFLWFGTQEGLCRYDGYRFVVHRARSRPGFLWDHNVNALLEDARGNLWIGTDRGIHRLDPATGRVYRPQEGPTSRVLAILEDAAGRVWFSAPGGLWVLEASRPTRVEAAELPRGALLALARGPGATVLAAGDGKLVQIDLDSRPPRATELLSGLGQVTALAGDGHGRLWIGRAGGELLRYTHGTGSVEPFPQAPRQVLSLLPARDGTLWVGARAGGLTRLDPATGAAVT